MATSTDQEQDLSAFVRARQERYIECHNKLDVPKIMEWFSDDVDYSDHGKLPSFTKSSPPFSLLSYNHPFPHTSLNIAFLPIPRPTHPHLPLTHNAITYPTYPPLYIPFPSPNFFDPKFSSHPFQA